MLELWHTHQRGDRSGSGSGTYLYYHRICCFQRGCGQRQRRWDGTCLRRDGADLDGPRL